MSVAVQFETIDYRARQVYKNYQKIMSDPCLDYVSRDLYIQACLLDFELYNWTIKLNDGISELNEENSQLQKRVEELEARNENLEERLNSNSRNSSRPPSTDNIYDRFSRNKKSAEDEDTNEEATEEGNSADVETTESCDSGVLETTENGDSDAYDTSEDVQNDAAKIEDDEKPTPVSLRPKSDRKPGGQPGHKGSGHKIDRDPDRVERCLPEKCQSCPNKEQCQSQGRTVNSRYVEEVKIITELTRYDQIEVTCPLDNEQHTGAFPPDASSTFNYGPSYIALCTLLYVTCTVSYKRIAVFMQFTTNTTISVGTVHSLVNKNASLVEIVIEKIKKLVIGSTIVGLDETGISVSGELFWAHGAVTDRYTIYSLSEKRGYDGMVEAGVIPSLTKYVIHDCWASYFTFENVIHALCNEHLLRELLSRFQRTQQEWCMTLYNLLLEINNERKLLIASGVDTFDDDKVKEYTNRYDECVNEGFSLNPMPVRKDGQRGRLKKGKTLSLLERLATHKDAFLRFMICFGIPFTNNDIERSFRMLKVRLKVSGCFRTIEGAEVYLNYYAFFDTARKHGLNPYQAYEKLMSGEIDEILFGNST